MANVLNRATKEYLLSVNTPDYPVQDWIHNPVVPNTEPRYWNISGDQVTEMTQAQKDAVDAAIAQARVTELKEEAKRSVDNDLLIQGLAAYLGDKLIGEDEAKVIDGIKARVDAR